MASIQQPGVRRLQEGADGYLIGDVSAALGVSAGTIRLWEAQGLLTPERDGNVRRYSESDVERLRQILLLRTEEHLNAAAIRRELGSEDGAGDEDRREQLERGRQLRAARRAAGWRLRDAASATGLSVSLISAVERGVAGASPTAMARLEIAYAGSHSWATSTEDHVVSRMNEGPVADVDEGVQIRWLSSLAGQLEPQLVTLEPGARSHATNRHAGEEFLFVVSGRLRLWVAENAALLKPGDSAHFPSAIGHRWENAGRGKTTVLWVTTERSAWRRRARDDAGRIVGLEPR